MISPSDREILSEMGKNCKSLRESLSLTQKDLAKRWGVTQAAVSSFERGDVDSYLWLVRYTDLIYMEMRRGGYAQCIEDFYGSEHDGEL